MYALVYKFAVCQKPHIIPSRYSFGTFGFTMVYKNLKLDTQSLGIFQHYLGKRSSLCCCTGNQRVVQFFHQILKKKLQLWGLYLVLQCSLKDACQQGSLSSPPHTDLDMFASTIEIYISTVVRLTGEINYSPTFMQ